MMSITEYGIYKTPSTTINNIIGNNSMWLINVSCSQDGKYILSARINSGCGILSSNYGQTFTDVSSNRGMLTPWPQSCAVSSNGKFMVIGSSDHGSVSTETCGIYISNNYGNTWMRRDPISRKRIDNVTISDDGNYLTFTNNNIYYISSNSGYNWDISGIGILTVSTNGKYICRYVVGSNEIYTSVNYGQSWSLIVSSVNIDTGIKISRLKLSSTGQTLVAISQDDISGGRIYISKNFIKNITNNTAPTWRRTNFPTLLHYKYINTNPLSTDVSYNYPDYSSQTKVLNNNDVSWNIMRYHGIALSSNGQNIIAMMSRASDVPPLYYDANIFISNDFGNTYRSILQTEQRNLILKGVCSSQSGQYILISSYHYNNGPQGRIFNYVTNNYTYSYTPIKIAYNNTFQFTFITTLYDCSGTYYLKNNNSQILSSKTIMTDTSINSITFTDISTNLFDYGNNTLYVYKQNDNPLEQLSGFDIQISDPMVINATCFLEGTKILAMDKKRIMKYIPIEKLKPGMLVKTLHAGFVPIKYIGYSTIYNPGLATRVRDQLFIYKKSAYPELTEDLVLTGNHSILVDTITDEEREQIIETLGNLYVTEQRYRLPAFNDKRAVPYEQRGDFRIWNLALENEDYYANYGIYANGLLVETTSCRYIKEISRMTLIE